MFIIHLPFLMPRGLCLGRSGTATDQGVGETRKGMEMTESSEKIHSGILGGQSQSPSALNSGCTLKIPWKL